MKTKNLFLVLLLLISFGNCDLFAQTVDQSTTTQTVKPKRKYTKKVKPEANYSTQGMPTDNTTSGASTKPRRTYTRKTPPTNTAAPTSGGVKGNHQILVGPRGGRYYINKNGNKTYVK